MHNSKPPIFDRAKQLSALRELEEIVAANTKQQMQATNSFMLETALAIAKLSGCADDFKVICDKPRHFKAVVDTLEKNILQTKHAFAVQTILEENAIPPASQETYEEVTTLLADQMLIVETRAKEYQALKERLQSLKETEKSLVAKATSSLKAPVTAPEAAAEDATPSAGVRKPPPFLAGIQAKSAPAAAGRPVNLLAAIQQGAALKKQDHNSATAATQPPASNAKAAGIAQSSIAQNNKIKALLVDYKKDDALRALLNPMLNKPDHDLAKYTQELEQALNGPQATTLFQNVDTYNDEQAEQRRIQAQQDRAIKDAAASHSKLLDILDKFKQIGTDFTQPLDDATRQATFELMIDDIRAYTTVATKIATEINKAKKQSVEEIKQVETVLTAIQSRMSGITGAPAANAVEVAKLQVSNEKMRAELDAHKQSQEQLTTLQVQNTRLQEQIAEHSAKNRHLQAEIARLQNQMATNPGQHQQLQAQTDILEQQLQDEEVQLKRMQQASQQVQRQLHTAQLTVASDPDQTAHIKLLEDTIKEQQEQIAKLLTDSGSTRTGLARLTAAQHQQQEEIAAAMFEANSALQAVHQGMDALQTSTIFSFQHKSGPGATEAARQDRSTKKQEITAKITELNTAVTKLNQFTSGAKVANLPAEFIANIQTNLIQAAAAQATAQTTVNQIDVELNRLNQRRR